MNSIFLFNAIGSFIGYFNLVWIYGIVTNQKIKVNYIKILLIILISILNVKICYSFPVYIKTFYNMICNFGLTKIFYKNEFKYWAFHSVLIWSLGSFLDILFMSINPLIINSILTKYPNGGIVIITLFLQIIYNLLFRIKVFKKLISKIWEKIQTIKNIYWVYLTVIILLIVFGLLAFTNLSSLTKGIKILFLLLIALSISIYIIIFKFIENTYNETSKNLIANNSFYVELNNKNRIFKHNIIHKLDGIKSIADDKVKKLINDLIKEYNLTSSPNKVVDNLPNGINGLICQKIYNTKGKKINIAVNNYMKSDLFDVLTPKKYNRLCEALGVCLDNAISATLKTKEKILQIAILENQDFIYIKIINTFKSELEIDKLGTKDYTTKRDGHGIGLYSLFARKDLTIKTSIINNLFENQIIIKKNKYEKSNHFE